MKRQIIDFLCDEYHKGKSYGILRQETNNKFKLKYSRNQVAGIIFRLQRKGALNKRIQRLPKIRIAPFNRHTRVETMDKPTNPPKLFLDLNPCECKFALGNIFDPPKLFCAAETIDSSYCGYHRSIVYSKYSPKELKHENSAQS